MNRSKITLDTVVIRVKDPVSSDMDGESVMLSINQGKYYSMDPIGSRIWTLLEQPRSVSVLCNILLEEFEVSREQCWDNVLAFLNALAVEKLVEVLHEDRS